MPKTRVYVSFDYDNDKELKDFVVGQSRLPQSPFEVVDCSIKEAVSGDWTAEAKRRIRSVDVVLVVVGENTHRAQGVLIEVKLAIENNKRVAQIIGRRDSTPKPVTGAGRLYRWSWDNLANIIG